MGKDRSLVGSAFGRRRAASGPPVAPGRRKRRRATGTGRMLRPGRSGLPLRRKRRRRGRRRPLCGRRAPGRSSPTQRPPPPPAAAFPAQGEPRPPGPEHPPGSSRSPPLPAPRSNRRSRGSTPPSKSRSNQAAVFSQTSRSPSPESPFFPSRSAHGDGPTDPYGGKLRPAFWDVPSHHLPQVPQGLFFNAGNLNLRDL